MIPTRTTSSETEAGIGSMSTLIFRCPETENELATDPNLLSSLANFPF